MAAAAARCGGGRRFRRGAGGRRRAAVFDVLSTSPLVSRPPLPVPVIVGGRNFSSSTSRRTAGESGRSPPAAPCASAGVRRRARFCALASVVGCGAAFGRGGGLVGRGAAAAGAAAPSSISATTWPILTSSPSCAWMVNRPATRRRRSRWKPCRFPGSAAVVGLTVAVLLVPGGDDAAGDGFADCGDFDFECSCGEETSKLNRRHSLGCILFDLLSGFLWRFHL